MRLVLASAILAVSVATTYAMSNGAPISACGHMIPGHGPDPQTGPAPFALVVQPNGNGQKIVGIVTDGTQFKGYMIQGFVDNKAAGSFLNTNAITCDNVPSTAATHTNSEFKNEVRLLWQGPDEATFRATVVQDYSIIYTIS